MGFVAGLGHPGLNCGVPTYYMDQGAGNTWDANTYATVYFDGSGSMNAIITPLQNAMGGNYFSSGSAAGGDGVKSTTSLRAILQDLYATGGIEGAPDYNTNNATNGKDEFEKHVQFITLGDERTARWLATPYKYNGSATWPNLPTATTFDDSDFITPSNFVTVCVCNESHDNYHDGQAGSTWANNEITTTWKSDINLARAALESGGTMDSHAAGTNPSFTAVILDPGGNIYSDGSITTLHHNGPSFNGIQTTASQALWAFGGKAGQGSYAADAVDVGETYSLSDLSIPAGTGLMAWNDTTNALVLQFLDDKSKETSVSFWKQELLNAFQVNLLIPGA